MEAAESQVGRISTGMDDARRFLRQITPGIAFILQAFLYWFLLDKSGASGGARAVMTSGALGGGVALLLASVGIGFLLSTIHHCCYSCRPIDYKSVLQGLVKAGALGFRGTDDSKFSWCADQVGQHLSKDGAWRVVARLWHQRSQSVELIRSCLDRNKSLFDFMHGNGAGFWAAFLAPIVPALGLCLAEGCLNCLRDAWPPRLLCVVCTWLVLSSAQYWVYRITRNHAAAFLQGALLDGLYSNRGKEPVVWCTLSPSDYQE